MRGKNHIFDDIVITIYYMDKGEKVPRHIHDFVHTTCCLNGKTLVSVDGFPPTRMYAGDASMQLPGAVYHEVEALEDNTIAMHCFKREYLGVPSFPVANFTPDIVRPGVLMHDGTIEYPNED